MPSRSVRRAAESAVLNGPGGRTESNRRGGRWHCRFCRVSSQRRTLQRNEDSSLDLGEANVCKKNSNFSCRRSPLGVSVINCRNEKRKFQRQEGGVGTCRPARRLPARCMFSSSAHGPSVRPPPARAVRNASSSFQRPSAGGPVGPLQKNGGKGRPTFLNLLRILHSKYIYSVFFFLQLLSCDIFRD